jgi:hypothetical protein
MIPRPIKDAKLVKNMTAVQQSRPGGISGLRTSASVRMLYTSTACTPRFTASRNMTRIGVMPAAQQMMRTLSTWGTQHSSETVRHAAWVVNCLHALTNACCDQQHRPAGLLGHELALQQVISFLSAGQSAHEALHEQKTFHSNPQHFPWHHWRFNRVAAHTINITLCTAISSSRSLQQALLGPRRKQGSQAALTTHPPGCPGTAASFQAPCARATSWTPGPPA